MAVGLERYVQEWSEELQCFSSVAVFVVYLERSEMVLYKFYAANWPKNFGGLSEMMPNPTAQLSSAPQGLARVRSKLFWESTAGHFLLVERLSSHFTSQHLLERPSPRITHLRNALSFALQAIDVCVHGHG